MSLCRRSLYRLLLIVAFLPVTATAALPAGVTKVTSVEGIAEYRLANGLTVLLFPDATKPTITVNITYLVGSRHEDYGETGMAHLLEHMLFKGTPSVAERLRRARPARHAVQRHHVVRPHQLLRDVHRVAAENLDWALELEADRMTRSTFSKTDLDTEMTVVRNEFESGENRPQSVLWKRMAAVAFDWHNYGKSTIGARSDIENVPIERLQAFYRKYYQPDNAVLIVAGKFDADARSPPIARYFGAIPQPTRDAAEALHRWSRCRTASASSPCAASPARNGSARCSTCRRAPIRTRRRSRRSPRS